MNPKRLTEAVDLAAEVGHVFIATADLSGRPIWRAARKLSLGAENQVVVSDWLCPETVNQSATQPLYINGRLGCRCGSRVSGTGEVAGNERPGDAERL